MSPLAFSMLNLRARPMRNALLTLIVALAAATALTLLVLADSIREGLRAGSDERGADLTVSQRGAADLLSSTLPSNLAPRLAAITGVAGVSGELVMFAPIDGSRQSIVAGWNDSAHFWKGLPLRAGRLPVAADQHPAILGAGIAEALGKKIGDSIDILGDPFNVIGIAGYVSAMNRGIIFLRLNDLENLAMRSNQVTGFHLTLKQDREASTVSRISREIEGLGRFTVSPTDQLLRSDRNYEFLQAVSRAISMIALLTGSLSIGSALMMAVTERRREIGIMMAIGWSDARIRAAFIAEGMMIGLLGGFVAIPLVLLTSLMFHHLPGIGEILAFKLTVGVVLSGIGASLVLCTLGALYPAIVATRMNPSQALRTA
jgi:putative ABC transport system permease protein